MIFLMLLSIFILLVIIIAILDALNITHIFMKGRSSGTVGSALRAAQDAFEMHAKSAHEYIMEEKEKDDTPESSTISDNEKKYKI
ncbi:MAG: hypothetical protein B5M53_05515 [Candidatus Cloacimonas sp. 4484_209]|nr:MAG: hypothetical protein B5M53_05515 [Candidatus Cloacimonas sp. 4484_209]